MSAAATARRAWRITQLKRVVQRRTFIAQRAVTAPDDELHRTAAVLSEMVEMILEAPDEGARRDLRAVFGGRVYDRLLRWIEDTSSVELLFRSEAE
jgi:hypothetical protein